MRCCNSFDSKLALTTENTQVYFNIVFGHVTAVPCAVPSLVQDLCVTMVITISLNDTYTDINNIILLCSIDKLIDVLQYIMILSLPSLVASLHCVAQCSIL